MTATVTDRPIDLSDAGPDRPAESRELERHRATGALQVLDEQTEWSPQQRAALSHIGLADAPAGDTMAFLHLCQRTRLDPWARQIYLVGRFDKQSGTTKYTPQTGIDGFRVIAERRPEYAGQTAPQWCGPDGVWLDVWLNRRQPPAACRVGVYRDDRAEPVWAVCVFEEFAQYTGYGDGRKLNSMWGTKPAHMISKCSEATALRKAFPQDLSGLYTDDEMGEAGVGPAATRAVPQRRRAALRVADITQGATDQPSDTPDPAVTDPASTPPRKDLMAWLAIRCDEVGIARDERIAVVSGLVGRSLTSSKDLSGAELDAVVAQVRSLGPDGLAALRPTDDAAAADPDGVTDAEVVDEPAAGGGTDTAVVSDPEQYARTGGDHGPDPWALPDPDADAGPDEDPDGS